MCVCRSWMRKHRRIWITWTRSGPIMDRWNDNFRAWRRTSNSSRCHTKTVPFFAFFLPARGSNHQIRFTHEIIFLHLFSIRIEYPSTGSIQTLARPSIKGLAIGNRIRLACNNHKCVGWKYFVTNSCPIPYLLLCILFQNMYLISKGSFAPWKSIKTPYFRVVFLVLINFRRNANGGS